LHCRSEFHFSVRLAYAEAFPLFGGWKEQEWDPDWKPIFLYPDPARDIEGAVFLVKTPEYSSVWVNTEFDISTGRVQYVNVRDGLIATRIQIQVRSLGLGGTQVSVAYERTALDPAAAPAITEFARTDPEQGAQWQAMIEAAKQSRPISPISP
jgi:hypothetical protein